MEQIFYHWLIIVRMLPFSETKHLLTRARLAKEAAAKVISFLNTREHPYQQLIANEFQFVIDTMFPILHMNTLLLIIILTGVANL